MQFATFIPKRGFAAGLVFLIESYFLDVFLEVFPVVECSVFDSCPIVVDGVDRIVQEVGDLRRVVDSQPDECEDSDAGVESSVFVDLDLLLGSEECVEVADEVGEEMQECGVETDVEVFEFLVSEFGTACELVQVVVFMVFDHAVDSFPEVLHFVDIHGAEPHEVCYIFLFDAVRLAEEVVGRRELCVEAGELRVERGQL